MNPTLEGLGSPRGLDRARTLGALNRSIPADGYEVVTDESLLVGGETEAARDLAPSEGTRLSRVAA